MPFQKGNQLGKTSHDAKVKKQEDLWAFIASGGARRYHECVRKQFEGEQLTEEEEKAMDRVEKMFPYVKSKAPTESKIEVTLPTPLTDV